MTFLPILLDCKGKLCCIIGGGCVAERKIKGLLDSEARIRVISPSLTPALNILWEHKQIHWMDRSYRKGDLRGASLVYAATNRRFVNEMVMLEAREQGILVQVADCPHSGDFITPAVLRRGKLSISVSTGGAGPAVAADIESQLEDLFGDEYEGYIEFMDRMRRHIKECVPHARQRAALLRKLVASGILQQIRTGVFREWSQEERERWIALNQEDEYANNCGRE